MLRGSSAQVPFNRFTRKTFFAHAMFRSPRQAVAEAPESASVLAAH
jgi:hypothetical protein